MASMTVMQVSEPGAALELVERPIPEPGPGEVRVKVQACGVCHSDSMAVDGHFPGVTFPVVPGHEVAGVIDAVGEGVPGWSVGQRVGVGWFGGNCTYCEPCRRGDLIGCQNMPIPGVTINGAADLGQPVGNTPGLLLQVLDIGPGPGQPGLLGRQVSLLLLQLAAPDRQFLVVLVRIPVLEREEARVERLATGLGQLPCVYRTPLLLR